MGGSQGESPGDSRGSSLTNGDLSEEQIPGSVARRQSSKSHGSPGNSAGSKVCSPRHGVTQFKNAGFLLLCGYTVEEAFKREHPRK